MTGSMMNETLGKLHFWISLIAAYGTFLPMHLSGLAGEPRHYERLTGPAASFSSIAANERGITFSAVLLAAAQLIFLWNIYFSARRGRIAPPNPWQATTLEWAPETEFVRIERGPYEYENLSNEMKLHPQWERASKEE
jgi:cytochrome c oxidase subunit I